MPDLKEVADDIGTAFQFVGFLPPESVKTHEGKNVCPFGYKFAIFSKASLAVDFVDAPGFFHSIESQRTLVFFVPDIEDNQANSVQYTLLNHLLVYKELEWLPLSEELTAVVPAGRVLGYLIRAIPWYLGSHLDRISEFSIHQASVLSHGLALADPAQQPQVFDAQFQAITWFVHYYYYFERIFVLLLHAKWQLGHYTQESNKPTGVPNFLIDLFAHDCALLLQPALPSYQNAILPSLMATKAIEHWFDIRRRVQFPGLSPESYKTLYYTLNGGIPYRKEYRDFVKKQIEAAAEILPEELFDKRCADLLDVPSLDDSVEYAVLDLSDGDVFMCTHAQADFGIFALQFKTNDGTHETYHSAALKNRPAWCYVETVAVLPGSRSKGMQCREVWRRSLHPFLQRQCFAAGVRLPFIVWQWKSKQHKQIDFECPCDDIALVLRAIHEKDDLYPWVSPHLLKHFEDYILSVTGPEGSALHYNEAVHLLATDAPGQFVDGPVFLQLLEVWQMCKRTVQHKMPLQVSLCAPQLISDVVFTDVSHSRGEAQSRFFTDITAWFGRASESRNNPAVLYLTERDSLGCMGYFASKWLGFSEQAQFPVVICLSVLNDHGPFTQVLLTVLPPFKAVTPTLLPKIEMNTNLSISALSMNITFATWLRIYEERTAPSLLSLAARYEKIDSMHVLYYKELVEALPFKVQLVKSAHGLATAAAETSISVHIVASPEYALKVFLEDEQKRKNLNKPKATQIQFYYRNTGRVATALPLSTVFKTIFMVAANVPVSDIALNVIVDSEISEDGSGRAQLAEIARYFYTA